MTTLPYVVPQAQDVENCILLYQIMPQVCVHLCPELHLFAAAVGARHIHKGTSHMSSTGPTMDNNAAVQN